MTVAIKKGKTNRKYGRNKRAPNSGRYFAENRRLKNKIKTLKRHIKNQPNDKSAIKCLEGLI